MFVVLLSSTSDFLCFSYLGLFALFIVSMLHDGQYPSDKAVCIWSWDYISLLLCPIVLSSETDSLNWSCLRKHGLQFYLAFALERFLLICRLTSEASIALEFC